MKRRWAWLFDIGSTFTKLTVVDLDGPRTFLRAQSPTTVATDVREGFHAAIDAVHDAGGPRFEDAAYRAASSSAAGGLALVVSGLVPRLSAEAGRIAALGAGAKLVGTLAYRLTDADVDRLRGWTPDIVLLTGGTDGGDRETLFANAQTLAGWRECPTVIVAGNREVSAGAADVLREAGIVARVVPNILPELDRLEVGPVREAIRDEFLTTIVHAKGIDLVRDDVDADILPTPGVVLDGVELLAERIFPEGVMVVEVGGATTNVHSFSPHGVAEGVVVRGLHEPPLRRTVEGDLGVRWNADTILDLAGASWFAGRGVADEAALEDYVRRVTGAPETLPADAAERGYDALLATFAGRTAISRHCGRQREVHLPEGPVLVQEGSDMRRVGTLIGTGGSVVSAGDPAELVASLVDTRDPFSLVPAAPAIHVDNGYALYACGLLARHAPDAAVELCLGSIDRTPSLSIC